MICEYDKGQLFLIAKPEIQLSSGADVQEPVTADEQGILRFQWLFSFLLLYCAVTPEVPLEIISITQVRSFLL